MASLVSLELELIKGTYFTLYSRVKNNLKASGVRLGVTDYYQGYGLQLVGLSIH